MGGKSVSEDARDAFVRYISEKYGGLIRTIAESILINEEDIKEALQDVFTKCAFKSETLKAMEENNMKSYICTIAKNCAISIVRKNEKESQKTSAFIERYGHEMQTMDYIDFSAFEDKYGFGLETQELLKQLDPTDRDIVMMKYGLCLPHREIAAALNISESYVKKRVERARVKMMNILVDSREG